MKRALGYIRVSTDEQAKEGVSLAAQEAKIRAYAALNDLELVEVIVDAGKSAKDTRREGLQVLLKRAEAGEADAIIVAKLDRLSRRVVDTLTLIERIEAAGLAFHSIQEKVDTKSAIGRFFLAITAAFAQMERDAISERTVMALSHKKENGEHVGKVPFGYTIENAKLTPRNEEQEVISLIAGLRSKGYTLQQIANELNSRGIATAQRKLWRPQSVKNVLMRIGEAA